MSMDLLVPVSADIESPKNRGSIRQPDKHYYKLTGKDNNFTNRYERNYTGGASMTHLEDDAIMNN